MAGTEINYSVFDSDCEIKATNYTSNTAKVSSVTSDDGRRHFIFKRTTVYAVAGLIILILIGIIVGMYFITNKEHDNGSHVSTSAALSVAESKCQTKGNVTSQENGDVTQDTVKGCPQNWLSYNGSCYYFSNDSGTWSQALIRCIDLDSTLVEIDTLAEDRFLQTTIHHKYTKDCYHSSSSRYHGNQRTTFEDLQCQRWDAQYPQKHTRNNISRFPDTTLRAAENFCRDPDDEGIPWCYTTNPSVRWQYCDIYKCPGDFWIGLWYQGRVNEWRWIVSKERLSDTHQHWAPGQSPRPKNTDRCAVMSAANYLAWNYRKCSWPAYYICEKSNK